MGMGRAVCVAAAALFVATGCSEEAQPPPPQAPPTAPELASCLEDRGVSVREKRRPGYGAVDELVVGEELRAGARVGPSVLFFESPAAAQQRSTTFRIAGEAAFIVGNVAVLSVGPGFVDAERGIVACLEGAPSPPAP